MGYLLIGALFVGAFLFFIGWLMVVVNGFQRHPVSGVVALIPGLNLLILPSVWHRVGGWVITGGIGLVLAGGAWLAGAGTQIYQQVQKAGLPVAATATKPAAAHPTTPAVTPVALPTAQPPAAASVVAAPPPPVAAPTPAPVVLPGAALPTNALYHIGFKDITADKLSDAEGNYVRITQLDGHTREGKLQSLSGNTLLLDERQAKGVTTTTAIKLSDIRQAAVMTKQGEE